MARKHKQQELRIVGEPEVIPHVQSQSKPEIKLSFDQWWTLTRQKRNLPETLKESLKLHFKAWGFLESGKFDNGILHFGFKP
jgi:hypothetical protein